MRHLTRFFDATTWKNFGDGDDVCITQGFDRAILIFFFQSFFSLFRNLFTRLSSEERIHEASIEYPPFGLSTWKWATGKQDINDNPRDFYNVWVNFTTEKDFSWLEQWNINEAPERRVRRCVEISVDQSHPFTVMQINGKG